MPKSTPRRGSRVAPKPRARTTIREITGGKTVDYKDVSTLRKFLSDRGKIRSRRVTGLSPQEQRQVATAVRNAREMALLPYRTH
ncbi:MAG: 30S ribosomal protein S18 [Gordonia sp. (in: high G+C Gram-positive bacteria)]